MKVPAGQVTVGMHTESHGKVQGIGHSNRTNPVIIEGAEGTGFYANEDLVEIISGVYRLQYYDFAWGGFRDIEPGPGESCFVSQMNRADLTLRQIMGQDGNLKRNYRIVKADGSTATYRRVNSRIVVSGF